MNLCNPRLWPCMNSPTNDTGYENDVENASSLHEECAQENKVLSGMSLVNCIVKEEQFERAETLCMIGNNFDDYVAEYVASTVLPRCHKLRVVDLASTRFSPPGLIALFRSLLRSPSDALEELSLCDMHLHGGECASIHRLMTKHSAHMKRLYLQRCHVDDTAAQELVEGIAQMKSLIEVKLTDNDVIPALAIPVDDDARLFFPSTLKLLDISGNRIESVHQNSLAVAFTQCIGTLEELYMSRCCVTETLLKSLLRVGLHSSHSLRVLNVSFGRLLYTAGKVLCSILTECPNLERLYVQGNLIEADGAARMAIGIPCAKNLKVLGLGSCHLSGKGARTIAEAVKDTPSLRELDLSNNSVTDEDVFHICAYHENISPQLSLLDLSDNPLTVHCRSALETLFKVKRGATASCTVLVRGTAIGESDLSYLTFDKPTDLFRW